MFTKIEDFIAEWNNESAATQRVLDTLTDESLNQRIGTQNRSLGRLGWHLVTTLYEMPARAGLSLQPPGDDKTAPVSASLIAETYRKMSQALLEAVRTQWTDETLAQTRNMYGEEWPNGLTLRVLIQHEVHHRGQVTVLMREAGLRVPGIYGPALEEWQDLGMQPPAV